MQINLSDVPVFAAIDGGSAALNGVLSALPAGSQRVIEDLLGTGANRHSPGDVVSALHAAVNDAGEAQSVSAWVLLKLAFDTGLMLPASMGFPRTVLPSELPLKLPPLLEAVDDHARTQRPRWIDRGTHLSLLLATDCRNVADFDLHAFESLHTAMIRSGRVESELSLSAPAYVVLRGLEEAGALMRSQRHAYVLWRASKADEFMSLSEFLSDTKNLAGMRIHGHARERIELPLERERRKQLEQDRNGRQRQERPVSPQVQQLLGIVEENSLESPARYFEALARMSQVRGFRAKSWLSSPTEYPGREHVGVAQFGERWFAAFRAFLQHRKRDYETDKEVRTALHIFADYLFLYLPWWREMHPKSTLAYPGSPKDFSRYLYVDRTRFSDASIETADLPQTFYELLVLRQTTPGSRNTTRRILNRFFNFVLTYYEDSEGFVARGMLNPIRLDYDNEVAGRAGKTDKVPFSDDVFPFLVHYGQAVEAFGEYLQVQAYQQNAFRKLPWGDQGGYDTAEWGFTPVFYMRGVLYKVRWIPNLYTVSKRTLANNPPTAAGIYISGRRVNRGKNDYITLNFPSLTTVRLLIALVETGLRGQSVQWLDRRNFDSLAKPVSQLSQLYRSALEQDFHPLFINTDKVHNEWDNLVSWRVRRSLWAEAHFQASVVDEFVDTEVAYEDRENTRFLPIVPLFRTDGSEKPVSDGHYSDKWVDLLYGFQVFYNSKDGRDRSGTPDEVAFLTPREGVPESARLSERFLAIHTPHACRATYATLKDGDLEVSEIADQLGHSNTVVTNTYQVPSAKGLAVKLKRADSARLGLTPFDPSGQGDGYIHTEREDSTVRKAFQSDREQAISDFGFVPGVALWSLSELDGNSSTLELLRQSPASVIRWHATHVCPVGNQCPKEVVANTGEMNRCGLCPLAAKCVDHLPAIEAKQNELRERVRTTAARLQMRKTDGAFQSELDALHRSMQLDTKELLGWKLSAEILRSRQHHLGSTDGGYHVDQPDIVRKQLELVSRDQSDSEFFLQRIAESNAYPSLETPEVRAKASRYTRLILARQGRLEDAAFLEVPPHKELTVFASMVKPFIEAKGLTLAEVAAEVDGLPAASRLIGGASALLVEAA